MQPLVWKKHYCHSYKDSVENERPYAYRIIALGIKDEESFNEITEQNSNSKLTTASLLEGLPLAFVMLGVTFAEKCPVRSTIKFSKAEKNPNTRPTP
ncbi:MAG: hypothetical protein OXC63_07785 [Aestuariivita sp.]|nr:hypothetical protein [Aestuariivita sp.]